MIKLLAIVALLIYADGPDVIYLPVGDSCPAGYTSVSPPVQIGARYYMRCQRY
jgi:hypothetical protein